MWPLTQGRQSPLFPGTAVAHRILGRIRNQGAGSILGKPPPGRPGLGWGPAHRTQHGRPVPVCGPPPRHAGGTSVSARGGGTWHLKVRPPRREGEGRGPGRWRLQKGRAGPRLGPPLPASGSPLLQSRGPGTHLPPPPSPGALSHLAGSMQGNSSRGCKERTPGLCSTSICWACTPGPGRSSPRRSILRGHWEAEGSPGSTLGSGKSSWRRQTSER